MAALTTIMGAPYVPINQSQRELRVVSMSAVRLQFGSVVVDVDLGELEGACAVTIAVVEAGPTDISLHFGDTEGQWEMGFRDAAGTFYGSSTQA